MNAALLGLLGVARRIFSESSVWLLLKDPSTGKTVLFPKDDHVESAAGFDEPPSASRLDATAVEQLFPALTEAARKNKVSLQGATTVMEGGQVIGALAVTSEKGGDLPECDWRTLEELSGQTGLILEKTRTGQEDICEAMLEIHRNFSLVTDHVLEVICRIDPKGVIQFINPSAERRFGYEEGELTGQNVFALIHDDDRVRGLSALREGEAAGCFETEVRGRRKDGSYVPFLCYGVALRDEPGLESGYFVAARDISRRRKAEAELRRLESRFQLVWENSRDAMRLTDSKGTILQVNDAYCTLVDKPRQDLVGQSFVVAYNFDDPDGELREFQARVEDRTIPAQVALELTLWNGSERTFELSNSLFEVEGETLLLTIYHDITDRRRKEAELERLNEALRQRANDLGALTLQLTRVEQEERRRLAQSVHDNLQQLLVAARMGMERIKPPVTTGLEGAFREVQDLLDESIKTSRSITVELSPPVLHDAGLMAAIEWLGRRMRDKHGLQVRIVADQTARNPSEVLGVFLFQAVRELLCNCHRHAGVHEVSVFVEWIGEERIRIEVEDRGAGFNLEDLDSAQGERDCFGLFSLRERIDHIGGSMKIDSEPGKGTRVILIAPLEPNRRHPPDETDWICQTASGEILPEPTAQAPESEAQVRLVLVDDHKIMRQGLRELFREQTDMVIVGEGENGVDALRLAQELQPDVIVMDISMPVMNGIEATRVLAVELPHIKVIGLSMHVKEDMATAILAAGASAYVTKSTAAEALTDTIRQVMRLPSGGARAVSFEEEPPLGPERV